MVKSSARRSFAYRSRSIDDTGALAVALGSVLTGGDVVLLVGDLGAGKTAFAKRLGAALGVSTEVSSPTFTIMAEHRTSAGGRLLHLDAYRLEGPDAVEELGLFELLDDGAVAVIEWGDLVESEFGDDALTIAIRTADEELGNGEDPGNDEGGDWADAEREITVSAAAGGPWDARTEALARAMGVEPYASVMPC